MSRTGFSAFVLSIGTALLVGGCADRGAAGTPAPGGAEGLQPPTLGVSNGTTIDVVVLVNGVTVGTYPSGQPIDPVTIEAPPPWHVEARTAGGRTLVAFDVSAAAAAAITASYGQSSKEGALGRVDLSCGRLTVWIGEVQPSGPAPIGSPGSPGDCA